MRLETDRVILRDFVISDLDDLYEILGDGEVMEYLEPPYDKGKTRDFLNNFCIERSPKGAFAVELKETGKVIGYVLFKSVSEPEIFEIGWIFNKRFWHKGYACEICKELIRYGFTEMNLHKICAETVDSEKSVPFMKKLGMTPEGVQRKHVKLSGGSWNDLYWYAILEEDYYLCK